MRGHHIVLVAAGLGLCAWCGWVSVYHRSTTPAEITWVVSLGAVIAADVALWRGRKGARFGWHLEPVAEPWPRPRRGGGRRALRGVAPWLVLLAVALAWDVLGIDTGPHQYHLTISALAQAYRPLNAGLLLVWMLVGVGYQAARVRAPSANPSDRVTSVRRDPPTPASGAVFGAGLVNLGAHPTTPGLLLPSSPPVGIAFWVAVPCAALLVDLVARRSAGRVATAEEFIRFISTAKAANVALIAAWVFAGYHLFAALRVVVPTTTLVDLTNGGAAGTAARESGSRSIMGPGASGRIHPTVVVQLLARTARSAVGGRGGSTVAQEICACAGLRWSNWPHARHVPGLGRPSCKNRSTHHCDKGAKYE